MASLYDIDKNIEDIMTKMYEVMDETGEVTPELAEELQALNEARDQKLENIGAFIKNLNADVTAMKTEKDALDKRIKAKQRQIDWLKSYVSSDLLTHGQSKFESARVVFSFRESTAVDIPDETVIPKKYFIKKTEMKLDKEGIGKLLKEGQVIRGASLIKRQNLQIK